MTRQRTRSSRVLTPLYAVLGATELAVEKLADIGANATGYRADEQPDSRVAQAGRVLTGARQMPALAINQAIDTVVRTQEHYAGLAERGQRLAGRQAPVQQTTGLLRQAGERVARGRDAAADAAQRTRSAATHTVQAARSNAEDLAGDVVEAVSHPTRLGSVARPPRLVRPLQRVRSGAADEKASGASGAGEVTPLPAGESARPKPRRPRVNAAAARSATGQSRSDESSRSRSGVPAGAGVEAGATMPTKRSGGKTSTPKASTAKTSTAKTTTAKTTTAKTSASTTGAAKTTSTTSTAAPSTPSAADSSAGQAPASSTAPARKRPRRVAPVTAATSEPSPAAPAPKPARKKPASAAVTASDASASAPTTQA